jgi:hypothetical protein
MNWTEYRKRLQEAISGVIDSPIPIPPIHSIITLYAEFIGRVETALMEEEEEDGKFPELGQLCGVIPYGGGECGRSLLVADPIGLQIKQLYLTRTDRIASNIRYMPVDWMDLSAICVHPMLKDHYFIAYQHTLHLSDGTDTKLIAGYQHTLHLSDGTDTKLIAGGLLGHSFADGIGACAAFGRISGCVSTSDGAIVYVTDVINNSIRSVNVATGKVTTPAKRTCQFASKLTFYRSPTVKPDSVLFITNHNQILRCDIESSLISNVELKSENSLGPNAITCTANGTLIFSCDRTFSLYAVDPATCKLDRIAGGGMVGGSGLLDSNDSECAKFRIITDMFVDETAECLWLVDNPRSAHNDDADQTSVVRRVSVPPRIFWTKP